MRISGLASGMDTDEIIKQIIKAQRIPMDKLSQKKQLLEWKRDDYRALNSKILEFRNAAFDMKLQAGYLAKKASSSQENTVSVTASGLASEGQYSLRVDQLATAAGFTTGDLSGAAGGSNTLAMKLGLTGNSTITLTGEKGTATIAISTADTIDQMVLGINNKASETGVKVTYDSTMDRLFFVSAKTGESSIIDMKIVDNGTAANLDLNAAFNMSSSTGTPKFASNTDLINAGNHTFRVNVDGTDYNFNVTGTTTIQDLIDKINSDSNLVNTGVTASLSAGGEVIFYNPNMKPIVFSDTDGGNVVTALGLDILSASSTQIRKTGMNAEVLFNGVAAEYETNSFSAAGMTFTVKQVSATAVTVGVSQDADAVVDKIKKFVEKYNSLIDEVNKETREKRNRDFQPLTTEEREAMSEDEIKRWEEKARSGMLSNDQLLNNGLNSLRRMLNESITGLPAGHLKSMSDIGISNANIMGSTISGTYSDMGKLYIDENKLKKAITDNPDEVMALFTTDGATESSDGFATRLYNKASVLFTQITNTAGTSESIESNYFLGKESQRLSKQLSVMAERLSATESRYYRQFTAMEKYISQMNSQSTWLSQQFGTGG